MSMGRDVPVQARGNIAAMGGLIGAGVGGLGGLMLGRAWGGAKSLGSDEYRQKYIKRYAKVVARQRGISLDEATAYINSRMKPKSDKPLQEEGKKPMKKSAGVELPSSVEEAAAILQTVKAAGIAARRNGTGLAKQAAGFMDNLSGVGSQIKDYWGKLDPKAQNTLIGTGLGAGGGMLASLADEGNDFGLSALTGAAVGGLGTAAHQYLPSLVKSTTTPVDKPEDKPGFEIAAKDIDTDFGNKLEDNAGTGARSVYELGMIAADLAGRTLGTDVANIPTNERLSRAGGALLRGASTVDGAAHIGMAAVAEGLGKLRRERVALNDPNAIKRLNDNVALHGTATTPDAVAARRAQSIAANKRTGIAGTLGMARQHLWQDPASRQILSAAQTGMAAKPRGFVGRAAGVGFRQGVAGLLTHLALQRLRPSQTQPEQPPQ